MKAILHHRGPVTGGGPARIVGLVDTLTQELYNPQAGPQRPRVRVTDAFWFRGLYSRLEELDSEGTVLAVTYVRN